MLDMIKLHNIVFMFCAGLIAGAATAADLTGTASVNVTSDTSANAKNIAFDNARRQIIPKALAGYADAGAVRGAIKESKPSELMDIVSSSSIDGEQVSSTTYTANITMTLDENATHKWLARHGVSDTIGSQSVAGIGTSSVVMITLSSPISNWIEIRRIARDAKIDIKTKSLSLRKMVIETSSRRAFGAALQSAGWHYDTTGDVAHAWK